MDKINLYNNDHKNSVSIDNNNLFKSGIWDSSGLGSTGIIQEKYGSAG